MLFFKVSFRSPVYMFWIRHFWLKKGWKGKEKHEFPLSSPQEVIYYSNRKNLVVISKICSHLTLRFATKREPLTAQFSAKIYIHEICISMRLWKSFGRLEIERISFNDEKFIICVITMRISTRSTLIAICRVAVPRPVYFFDLRSRLKQWAGWITSSDDNNGDQGLTGTHRKIQTKWAIAFGIANR